MTPLARYLLALAVFVAARQKAIAASIPLAVDIMRELAGSGSPAYIHVAALAGFVLTYMVKYRPATAVVDVPASAPAHD